MQFTYGLPAAAGCSAECNFSHTYQNLYMTMRCLGRVFIRIVDNNMHENAWYEDMYLADYMRWNVHRMTFDLICSLLLKVWLRVNKLGVWVGNNRVGQ